MLKYLICLFLLGVCMTVHGQKVFQPKQINLNSKGVIYNEERAFDMRIHQSGFSFSYVKGELLTYYKTRYYFVEFGHIKDPRERRQNKNISFPSEGSSSSYAYGKQNSFFQIRAGIGQKRYLSEKARRKGLAVGINYQAGLTMGLLKPYYLELIVTPEDNVQNSFLDTQKYSEENHDEFLDDNDIFGGSSFFKGIEETNITVGFHAKLGLHFALGAFDKSVKAVETGIMVDIFPKKVPILVERDEISNKFYFLNLYLNLQLGKRK